MIGDPRLTDKPYGRRIWQSLPPMRRTRELAEVLDFLGYQNFHHGLAGGAPAT
jgi:ATP-dependent DNA helicase DinG